MCSKFISQCSSITLLVLIVWLSCPQVLSLTPVVFHLSPSELNQPVLLKTLLRQNFSVKDDRIARKGVPGRRVGGGTRYMV